MINAVTAAVVELPAYGGPEPVYAWNRWTDPTPGTAVLIIIRAGD